MSVNTIAFFMFVGNCWWESLGACYAALLLPLTLQTAWVVRARDRALAEALMFGAIVGFLWPFGEGVVVRMFGWWGGYLAPGPKLWDTPLYCVLIGWVASAYCFYWALRVHEMGYSRRVGGLLACLTALCIGAVGENLFVGARMWFYAPSSLDLFLVPAFVPVGYGLGYTMLPLFRGRNVVATGLAFNCAMLVICVSLGLLSGFFPR